MAYFIITILIISSIILPPAASGSDAKQQSDNQEPAYFSAITQADGSRFVIRLEDPKLIRQARDILAGEETSEVHISGLVVKAPAIYNEDWSFHLDPDSVNFFALAAEVCDATTLMVERELDDVGGSFLPGGRWCPWSSRLTGELDSVPETVITVASAASQSEVAVSPLSLASLFGEDLTETTESSEGGDLPTKLAGVEVEFQRSGSSQRRKAGLLFASPSQINFVVPEDVSPGVYMVKLIRDDARDLETATRVETVAPGVFFGETADGKYVAASLLRVRGDGTRSEEPVISVDDEGAYAPIAVDFGPAEDRLYLSLYGSGLGSNEVFVRVGSENAPVLYSGPQGSVQGLDQINVELPRSLASRSDAEITVSAENDNGHTMSSVPVKLLIKKQ